jgi:hypothetical protein
MTHVNNTSGITAIGSKNSFSSLFKFINKLVVMDDDGFYSMKQKKKKKKRRKLVKYLQEQQ